MDPVEITIPRVEVRRAEKMDENRTAAFYVVAPVRSKGQTAWYDSLVVLEDLSDARTLKLNLNKALCLQVQEGAQYERDEHGDLYLPEKPKYGYRFRIGTLVRGENRWFNQLPALDVDPEPSFSQTAIIEFMMEIAIKKLRGEEMPSWAEFFALEDDEPEQSQVEAA